MITEFISCIYSMANRNSEFVCDWVNKSNQFDYVSGVFGDRVNSSYHPDGAAKGVDKSNLVSSIGKSTVLLVSGDMYEATDVPLNQQTFCGIATIGNISCVSTGEVKNLHDLEERYNIKNMRRTNNLILNLYIYFMQKYHDPIQACNILVKEIIGDIAFVILDVSTNNMLAYSRFVPLYIRSVNGSETVISTSRHNVDNSLPYNNFHQMPYNTIFSMAIKTMSWNGYFKVPLSTYKFEYPPLVNDQSIVYLDGPSFQNITAIQCLRTLVGDTLIPIYFSPFEKGSKLDMHCTFMLNNICNHLGVTNVTPLYKNNDIERKDNTFFIIDGIVNLATHMGASKIYVPNQGGKNSMIVRALRMSGDYLATNGAKVIDLFSRETTKDILQYLSLTGLFESHPNVFNDCLHPNDDYKPCGRCQNCINTRLSFLAIRMLDPKMDEYLYPMDLYGNKKITFDVLSMILKKQGDITRADETCRSGFLERTMHDVKTQNVI